MNEFSLQLVAMVVPAVFLIVGVWLLLRVGTGGANLSRLLVEPKHLAVMLLAHFLHTLSRFTGLGGELLQLERELKRHLPVYSAETVRGREAEFIRDRLPKRFPIAPVVVGLLVFGIVAWWLSQ